MATIEYDPNRSARIALLHYVDGEKRYMLAPIGLKVGDTVISDRKLRSASETRCRCETSRLARRFTISSCARARAVRSSALPAGRPS